MTIALDTTRTRVVDITGCSACSGDHAGQTAIAIVGEHPTGATWWTTCPTNGEPVLIADRPEAQR